MASTATQAKGSGRHGNVQKKYISGGKVPDELKKLRGTYDKNNANIAARKYGAEDASQLMQPVDIPAYMQECPPTITNQIAKNEWELFIKPLIAVNVIKLTDLRTAEIYCDMWAAYQEFKAKHKMPSIKIAEAMTRLMTQMGLTPVSRHKVVRIMQGKGQVTSEEWGHILNHDDDDDDEP